METYLSDIKSQIANLQNQQVDIIYHPHSTYRMIKQGDAKIKRLFEHFFEVEIDTKEYGSYITTITYLDIYTKSCIISMHKENHSEE